MQRVYVCTECITAEENIKKEEWVIYFWALFNKYFAFTPEKNKIPYKKVGG
jgi:hypothetical protein